MATIKGELIAGVICMVISASLAFYITNAHWSSKWSKRDLDDQAAQTQRAQANLTKQHEDAIALADIDAKHQQEIAEVQKNADDTIARYRSGSLKLRSQFRCASRGVSEVATASGIRDAATKCGLSETDVEFLVRFAQRADVIAKQLASAQDIIRVYYKSINGEELK